MEPLFFGNNSDQLYGVYHGAAMARSANEGVVLFYPVGQEYMRIHRAYRWLADRLADNGFHVLRFDYHGQGDSNGHFADATVEQWRQDGQNAIEELVGIGGCDVVHLVGTRLGATIAALQCTNPLVKRLVLWEPRISGAEYVAEIQEQLADGEWPLANFVDDNDTTNLNGFGYSKALIQSISDSVIEPTTLKRLERLLALTSVPDLNLDPFIEAVRCQGVMAESRCMDGPTDWNRVDGIGGVFLPQRILHVICDWVSGA